MTNLILHDWDNNTEEDHIVEVVTIKKSELRKKLKNVTNKELDFKRHVKKAISETKDTLTYNSFENPIVSHCTQSVDLDHIITEEEFEHTKNPDGTLTLKNISDESRIGKTLGEDFRDNWDNLKLAAQNQPPCPPFGCFMGKLCLNKVRIEMMKKGLTVSVI